MGDLFIQVFIGLVMIGGGFAWLIMEFRQQGKLPHQSMVEIDLGAVRLVSAAALALAGGVVAVLGLPFAT